MWKFLSWFGRLLKGLAGVGLTILLAALALLYVSEREIPAHWLDRVTDRLSTDRVSVQIGRATYGLRRGLVLHRVRAFARGSIDPAFLRIDEVVLSLTIRPRRPYVEWIDSLHLRNLRCDNIPDTLTQPRLPPGIRAFHMVDVPGIDVTVAGAEIAGLVMDRVAGRLSIADGVIRFAQAEIVWPVDRWPEALRGHVTLIPSEARIEGQVGGKTTPERLRPLLERLNAHTVIRIGEKFTFTTDPVYAQSHFLVAPAERRCELRVAIKLHNVLYNGVPIREADAIIEGSGPETLSRVTIAPISVVSDAGHARASLIYDEKTETLDIDAQGEMAVGPLTQIIEELNEGELDGIVFGRPPRITVRGSVGVARNNPAPADLVGSVSAPTVSIYGLPLSRAFCHYHVRPDGMVRFTSFTGTFADSGRITGEFTLHPGCAENQAKYATTLQLADLPLPELCGLFGNTHAPPGTLSAHFEMSGRFAAEPPASPNSLRIEESDFRFEDGVFMGMAFARLSGRMTTTPETIRLTDLAVAWPDEGLSEDATGELTVHTADGRIDGRVNARANPARIRPLLAGFHADTAVAIGDRLALTSAPVVVRCDFTLDPRAKRHDLHFLLSAADFAYRGQPIRSMRTQMTISGREGHNRTILNGLEIQTAVGNARADLTHDGANDTLKIDADIDMAVEPFARLIGLSAAIEPLELRCDGSSRISAKGIVGLSPLSRAATALDGRLEIPNVTVHGFPLRAFACAYRIGANYAVAFTNLTAATLSGGKIAGDIFLTQEVAEGKNHTAYRTSLSFTALELAEIFESLGSSNRPPGKVDARLDLHGRLDGARILQPSGKGRVSITQGSILHIPLFAGFTDYLARNVPGVATLVNQSDGSFHFNATNGVISSSNILIEGELFSLSGKGQYAIPQDQFDFLVQAGIFKRGTLIGQITRVLTLPFSKLLLEFRVSGPAANPTWEYLGILERIAETVSDAISPASGKNKTDP